MTMRFGRFELQPGERRLLADGEPLTLGPRAFDLLVALAERPGQLVSKETLLDLVWAHLVVEENNLQVQVSTLRKLLGSDAIATVPGRGYRFTLPVAQVQSVATPSWAPTPQPAPLLAHLPPLLGRDEDLAALQALCAARPLVTLVGAGGIGKTRLARELAARRAAVVPAGVAWVELAALSDPALLPGAVAAALGLESLGPGDPTAALLAALRPLALWLVLDNAEHLLDTTAALAAELVRGAPQLRLLVTSQAPLRLAEEAVYRLEALTVPPPHANLAEAQSHGAVALLLARAQAANRRFALSEANLPAVIDICRRLDGLALALELAAARVATLGAPAVAQRLDQRFALLTRGHRGAADRHQTLQATYDWSHALLAPDEQRVFRALAVFAGSFALDAACVVLADARLDECAVIELIASLVDRSLLAVDAHEPPRYAFTDSGRAYALAKLEASPDAPALRARHAQALAARFEQAPLDYLQAPDAVWVARYEPELDNLRAALAWSIAHAPVLAAGLVGAAAPLWRHLALDGELLRAVEATRPLLGPAAVDVAGLTPRTPSIASPTPGLTPAPDDSGQVPPAVAARWWRAAQWAWTDASPERSREAGRQALALYRALGDRHGLYAELTALAGQWSTANVEARAALDEALALEAADWSPREKAWGWRARADLARAEGRHDDSRSAREQELAWRTQAGDERGRLRALAHLLELALMRDDADEAVRLGQALVAGLKSQRAPAALCRALLNLSSALLNRGDLDEAGACLREATPLAREVDLMPAAADELAWLGALRGRVDDAARWLAWGAALAEPDAGGGWRTRSRERAADWLSKRASGPRAPHAARAVAPLPADDPSAIAERLFRTDR